MSLYEATGSRFSQQLNFRDGYANVRWPPGDVGTLRFLMPQNALSDQQTQKSFSMLMSGAPSHRAVVEKKEI